MKSIKAVVFLCGALSVQAFAADQCESNFTSEGGFLKGKTFKTSADLSGVNQADAFKKVYTFLVKDGWKITTSDKEMGIIAATQDVTLGSGATAPLNVVVEPGAADAVKLSISYSISGGKSTSNKAVTKAFCDMVAAAK